MNNHVFWKNSLHFNFNFFDFFSTDLLHIRQNRFGSSPKSIFTDAEDKTDNRYMLFVAILLGDSPEIMKYKLILTNNKVNPRTLHDVHLCSVVFWLWFGTDQLKGCDCPNVRAATTGLYLLSGRTSNREITWRLEAVGFGFWPISITLKFDSQLSSNAAEIPVKFQSDTIIITSDPATSRCHDIWR